VREKVVDGSRRGHPLVRDVHSGEIVWEEFENDGLSSSLGRQLWVYLRGTSGAAGEHGPRPDEAVALRRGQRPAGAAGEGQADDTAAGDSGELVALRAWPTIEVRRVSGAPGCGASLAHSSCSDVISGTGARLDRRPRSRYLAHCDGGHTSVFTPTLDPVWSTAPAYPDGRFSDDGTLRAAGDWSKGAVYRRPAT